MNGSSARLVKRLTGGWAAAVVLLVFYGALLLSLREKSATFDEPGHATAGFVYWKFNDYRIDPENGNLAKRWLALPYLFSAEADRFPAAAANGWSQANSWLLADEWFNRSGHDTTAMLARGRAMSGLVAVALGAMVWLWSRKLFGPAGGMISLLLYALSPAFLANGALMTSDTPAALGFLATTWCIAATLEHITIGRVVCGTLAIGFLFLAKMSAVLIVPVAAILAARRILDGRPLPVRERRILARPAARAGAIAGVAGLQFFGTVLLVWACFGFRYEAFSNSAPKPHRFHHPWEWVLARPSPAAVIGRLGLAPAQREEFDRLIQLHGGADAEWSYSLRDEFERLRSKVLSPEQSAKFDQLANQPPAAWVPRLIGLARDHRALPEAFLFGYAHAWKTTGQLAAFFQGEIRQTGWWSFFPFLFAVKTPLATLALLGLAAAALYQTARRHAQRTPSNFDAIAREVCRPRQSTSANGLPQSPGLLRNDNPGDMSNEGDIRSTMLALLVLVVVYGAFAVSSNLNIGHRHLLPIYPPLFVLGGAVVRWFADAGSAAAITVRRFRGMRVAVIALLALQFAEVGFRFPHYLAYFNGIVTPDAAHRHVVDSSLDWGQELPAIARYLEERPEEPAYLAFFGVGSPAFHGINARHLGGFPALDWRLAPPLKLLTNQTAAELAAFARAHPQYDPDLVFRLDGSDGATAALMIQQSARLRLEPGLYLISASLLPPLFHGKVTGFWSTDLERGYRQLRGAVAPFLANDRDAKIAAMPRRPVHDWISLFDDFYDFRLSRLTTYLRTRTPDDIINHSILVYRLSAADLTAALDEPVPETPHRAL